MHVNTPSDDALPLRLSTPVREAFASHRPIVALETTLITHGLPAPHNLETAQALAERVRENEAEPAFIAVVDGIVRIGLELDELATFANDSPVKASRRDLSTLIAARRSGATTVAATMACAALAGIAIFATGGIGGVHAGGEHTLDVSADLVELGRTPVAVVCSGAKSILDLPRTLEFLETQGVPVIGYRTDELPAFYLRETGLKLASRLDSVELVARAIRANRQLEGGGLVVANPIPDGFAVDRCLHDSWLEQAHAEAQAQHISGSAVTPWVLRRLFELSDGRTLDANIALLLENAALGAKISAALHTS